jgi:hypothetical protein
MRDEKYLDKSLYRATSSLETFEKRPLSKSALICAISALHSDVTPRNIWYIPVVKILMRLDIDRNRTFFKGLISSDNGFQDSDIFLDTEVPVVACNIFHKFGIGEG